MANLSAMKKRAGLSMKGPPKLMNLGKDLSGDAKNIIDKVATTHTRPTGPSANAASINAKGMKD